MFSLESFLAPFGWDSDSCPSGFVLGACHEITFLRHLLWGRVCVGGLSGSHFPSCLGLKND